MDNRQELLSKIYEVQFEIDDLVQDLEQGRHFSYVQASMNNFVDILVDEVQPLYRQVKEDEEDVRETSVGEASGR